jgi:hypothetical protein
MDEFSPPAQFENAGDAHACEAAGDAGFAAGARASF